MIYIFHRAEGFYPVSLRDDADALANVECNHGTTKVTDSENRVVYQQPEETCTRCNGSGEITVLAGGGPDAYDVPATCPRCAGIGVTPAGQQGGDK